MPLIQILIEANQGQIFPLNRYLVFNNINENIEKHSNIRYFIVYLFS